MSLETICDSSLVLRLCSTKFTISRGYRRNRVSEGEPRTGFCYTKAQIRHKLVISDVPQLKERVCIAFVR